MNLLYILDFVPLGTRSFDHYLSALAKSCQSRGWRIRFVFGGEPSADFCVAMTECGGEWMVLPFPLRWRFWSGVQRQWPGYRPDVVLTSFLSVYTWPLLWGRLVGHYRGLVVSDESSGEASGRGSIKRWLRHLRGRFVGHYVDAVRTVSGYIAQRDIRDMGLPAAKVHAVWNGIDTRRFPFGARESSHEGIRILYMGQLIAEKGLDTLIDGLKALREAGIPFMCRIAGDGERRQELQTRVAELGLGASVCFLGFCGAPLVQYGWADIVVVPSHWAEAFGLVAIEAMASGAVVVVSDAGALPEVVGDAGVIVPARDAIALAHALTALAKDPRRRHDLAHAARHRVEIQFQIEQTVRGIQDILEKVATDEA